MSHAAVIVAVLVLFIVAPVVARAFSASKRTGARATPSDRAEVQRARQERTRSAFEGFRELSQAMQTAEPSEREAMLRAYIEQRRDAKAAPGAVDAREAPATRAVPLPAPVGNAPRKTRPRAAARPHRPDPTPASISDRGAFAPLRAVPPLPERTLRAPLAPLRPRSALLPLETRDPSRVLGTSP